MTYVPTDHPRAAGNGAYDRTCFFYPQKSCSINRDHRPAIPFQLEKRDHTNPEYDEKPCYYEDRLLIDQDNNAVLKWRHIPDTLSSLFEYLLAEII